MPRYVYAHGKRIEVETLTPDALKAPRPKRKPFVVDWVKFPAWWLEALQDASASACKLALTVLAEDYKRQHVGGDVVLSAAVTKMPHTTRTRATRELVGLGLIQIQASGKRAAVVSSVQYEKVSMPENG